MKKSFKRKIEQLIISQVMQNELKFIPTVIKILNKCEGKDNAIKADEIRQKLEKKHKVAVTDASIRRYINYIRINHLVYDVIANSNGYFIATTDEEVIQYTESLRHRAYAILCLMESYEI